MSSTGQLIVMEGVDGSGKRTQTDLLAHALSARGHACIQVSFPHYDSFFGRMIGRFLNGEFGPLEAVDPHFAALLYAGDRLEARPQLRAALAAGKTILADRYIASNLAHQGARVAPDQRGEFLAWLGRLEYEIYGLPAESLVVYLRVLPARAQQLVERKAARGYTSLKHDLLESDLSHLEQASRVYDALAAEPNWVTIECLDAATQQMRTPEAIHTDVLSVVEQRVLPHRPAQS
jgi:dTMP kinase